MTKILDLSFGCVGLCSFTLNLKAQNLLTPHFEAQKQFCEEMINLWIKNLNEFTMKSAIEDGMLVEFAEIQQREKFLPSVANMTVETMPNDNLVINSSTFFTWWP